MTVTARPIAVETEDAGLDRSAAATCANSARGWRVATANRAKAVGGSVAANALR
jgi:hypothetical protein